MTATNWLAALDAFEDHLERQSELIAEGRYAEVVPFEPPAGLPMLPRVLINRASELVDRAQAVTEQASRALAETGRQLARPHRLPVAQPRPTSAYLDARV